MSTYSLSRGQRLSASLASSPDFSTFVSECSVWLSTSTFSRFAASSALIGRAFDVVGGLLDLVHGVAHGGLLRVVGILLMGWGCIDDVLCPVSVAASDVLNKRGP